MPSSLEKSVPVFGSQAEPSATARLGGGAVGRICVIYTRRSPIDIPSPIGAQTDSVHLRPEACYRIPLRNLLTAAPTNLVVVGRCIGATHKASAAFRVTPVAMVIGQSRRVTSGRTALKANDLPVGVPYATVRTALL